MAAEALFDIAEPGEARGKSACKGRAIGIDLGTTNSLVAVVRAGQPVCLRAGSGPIVPSVVHYAADGRVVVGQGARELAPAFPQDTISSVKRFMGRGPADAEATRRLTPYKFAPGQPDGGAAGDGGVVRFQLAASGRTVAPIEVSAEILRVLKARAEVELGGELEGAVITVPAYFDDGQRQATRDAGRLAGLEVLRLLNEPTAAALAYGLDKQVEGRFAVFDLGGGTFDVSVLQLENGVFEVKSTGGDDFDRVVAAHLLAQMGLPVDGGGDRFLVRRALDVARAAKEALTEIEVVDVQVARPNGAMWFGRLARADLERLVRPVLDRCAPPVRRALKDAGLAPADLAGVILVGGATRMPLVRHFVRELFGREPLVDIDPEEVVALGAAIQADLLARGGREDVVLMDVVPLSLGLEMMGGVVEKLIARNTTIPCGATQTFTTYADNQTGFDLHVLQGERDLVADCRSLARFKLGGIPPMPAGMARLEITFLVDADGILRVSARELITGVETSLEVKPSYGLSEDDVERMLRDSFAHGESDVRARLLAEGRVEADRILAATRAAMASATADAPELLPEAERGAIDAAAAKLEQARAGADHHAIRAGIELLDATSKDFARRRMDRALSEGLRGRAIADVEVAVEESAVRAGHGPPRAERP